MSGRIAFIDRKILKNAHHEIRMLQNHQVMILNQYDVDYSLMYSSIVPKILSAFVKLRFKKNFPISTCQKHKNIFQKTFS